MPVVFDEISGEVAPERSAASAEQPRETGTERGPDPAERVRQELRLVREREQRLIAD